MSLLPFPDLQELVAQCRSERSRGYLSEAVASFEGGAFRAAVVGTWIAVCFDVIDKLRELALAGDAEAERQVEELEKTRRSGDVQRALKFEKEILSLVRDKFELISQLEAIDLERLQEDRNRCAHPSLVSDEEAYAPSPELVRAHIHSAVSHLLRQPPTQGKQALERLVRDINSEYFPAQVERAVKALSSGPLLRPRESLIRNFSILLLKKILLGEVAGGALARFTTALRAARKMHPAQVNASMASKLPALFRDFEDGDLRRGLDFFEQVEDSWRFLPDDVQLRMQVFVENLPTELADKFEFFLSYDPLKKAAEKRVRLAKKQDFANQFFFTMPSQVGDRLIVLLERSNSHAEADEIASFLMLDAGDLSVAQVKALISKTSKNQHVLDSSKFEHLIGRIRERKIVGPHELDQLLEDAGLEHLTISSEADDDIPF